MGHDGKVVEHSPHNPMIKGSNPVFFAQDGSSTAADGRLQIRDRILFINGQDVRNADLGQASALIQVS